jgi:serine/threonine protein kinase
MTQIPGPSDPTQSQDRSGDSGAAPQVPGHEILRRVGMGGMGVVYQARNTALDQFRAIKTIRLNKLSNLGNQPSSSIEDLRLEARLTATLRHPNIVAVHDYLEPDGVPCIVMEWVDGVLLGDAVVGRTLRERAELFLQIAGAVAYAHDRSVIHGDLKPGNIIVDRDGVPRVLDFGLARFVGAPDAAGETTVAKGTPLYMAPEQWSDQMRPHASADVYSLGLILYQLLTDSPPPGPETDPLNPGTVVRKLPLPCTVNRRIPEPWQRVCLQACEEQVERRYASVSALIEDLESALAGKSVRAHPSQYDRALEARVGQHLDALSDWRTEGLVTSHQADDVEAKYLSVFFNQFGWLPDARSVRSGTAVLVLGAAVMLSGIGLILLRYWGDLAAWQRMAVAGIPALFTNVAALLTWRYQRRHPATLLAVVGTLLVPVAALLVLSEGGLLDHVNDVERELFPEGAFTNRQLQVASVVGLAASLMVLRQIPFAACSAVVAVLYLASTGFLGLEFGGATWLRQQQWAYLAIWMSGFVLLGYVIGLWAGRTARSALALPWLILGCVGTVIVGAVLAYDTPRTYFELPRRAETPGGYSPLFVAREIAFVGLAILVYVLAQMHTFSRLRAVRLWSSFFFRILPPLLVVPLEFMSREPLGLLMQLNETPLYASELFAPLACLLVAAMSVWHQRAWFLSYAILHLAWSLYHLTSVHFLQELRWPLALVMVGAGLLVLGVWRECRRTFQAEPSPPAGTPGVSAYGDEVTSTQRTRPIGGGGSINEIS